MKNLMVDSCVFFKMIGYNNFVEKYGVENLDAFIENQKLLLNDIKLEIQNALNSEFFEEYSNLPFEEQIDKYKNWSSNKINSYKNFKTKIRHKLDNYSEYVSNEERQRKELEYADYDDKINKIVRFDAVSDLINNYKLKRDSIDSGILYRDALKGKYKLFTNSYSYDEILNHTIPNDCPTFKIFPKEDVNSLSKLFTIVYTKSNKIIQQVNDMSKDYRTATANKDERAMGEDTNSLKDFGDSKIAAFSNLTGMVLVTHNAKDFIFDKGIGKNNTNKLNHLMKVNKNYFGTTDAKIYTPSNIIKGDYETPKVKPGYKIESNKISEIEFDEQLEMI